MANRAVDQGKVEDGKDSGIERGMWANKAEFLLSCIGYCVGLGNVWRFPYLAYENGGGSFLIPYLIMLIFCGIPLFLVELTLGQFSGSGAMTAWRASTLFKGIGMGMMLVSFLVVIYYNVIIAWSLYYLFASFQSVLPWTYTCGQPWNSKRTCEESNTTESCTNCTMMTMTMSPVENSTTAAPPQRISPSEEYWQNRVLRSGQSAGMDDPGVVNWDLCLCLLLAWLIVFFCLVKGVKSSGKVVYFTATFPYVILVILFIKGCTLPGALDGIIFYVKPRWEYLAKAKVWRAAAIQIFYSLGISFGGLLTFASYNKFSNNLYRDTFIVAIGNCATSIFSGFVIFSVIGHMAAELGTKVEEVIRHGPGLAFIAYPEAVSLLPVPQLWSILFFFMLLTLGLDSQFAMVETVITGFMDEFPRFLRPKKTIFTAIVCSVCFLLGILLVTEGGIYWFEFYNNYSAYYGLLVLSLILCIAVSWGYGFFFTYRWRLCQDIELMIGFKPNLYFVICWMLISPALLLFVIIYSALGHAPLTLGTYTYPKWADDLGLCMSTACVAMVPLYMIYRVILALVKGESVAALIKPSSKWGPQDKSIAYDHLTGAEPVSALTITNITTLPTYTQSVSDDVTDPYPIKRN